MWRKCHCGELGYPTANDWYLCEWGHEFYFEPTPAQVPVLLDPTLILDRVPYANYIHIGTRKPSPYIFYSAA